MSNTDASFVIPHLGNNIRILRVFRNYTQSYMAKMLNISKSRYSQIEQDAHINSVYLYPIVIILKIDLLCFLNNDLSDKFEDSIIPKT